MTALSSLKLVNQSQASQNTVTVQRRNKLLQRLLQQKESVQALLDNTLYKPTQLAWVVDEETGEEQRQQVPKRFKRWYWAANDGTYFLAVRYGAKVLELRAGKNAIEVGKREQLIPTIDALVEAVEAGELDKQIEKVANRKSIAKKPS